jgi:hypothetical protein
MNKVRFHEPVTLSFRKSAGGSTMTFDAHRDWIIPNAQLDRIMQDANIKARTYKISKIDNLIPNFNVNVPKKPGANRALVYNGSGGYGDQLMTWPLTLILTRMGYEVHMMVDPGNQICWWNVPWVKSVHVVPMQDEVFQMFDHHIIFDTACNMMEHPNHPHPLDLMLRKIGIDPSTVPDNLKVVRPLFTSGEMAATLPYRERQLALYQFASANPVRNLPAPDSAFMLSRLSETFPQYTWMALYDEFIPKEYVQSVMEDVVDPDTKEVKKDEKGNVLKKVKFPNCIVLFCPNLRELWAITSQAKIVVAPDSMMVHVAGSLGIPCVGLWGPYDPRSRVKYYQKHYPVFNVSACPQAPCSHYLATFPKYCPPRAGRNVCEVMAAITPEQVIDGIHSLVPESKLQPKISAEEPVFDKPPSVDIIKEP